MQKSLKKEKPLSLLSQFLFSNFFIKCFGVAILLFVLSSTILFLCSSLFIDYFVLCFFFFSVFYLCFLKYQNIGWLQMLLYLRVFSFHTCVESKLKSYVIMHVSELPMVYTFQRKWMPYVSMTQNPFATSYICRHSRTPIWIYVAYVAVRGEL